MEALDRVWTLADVLPGATVAETQFAAAIRELARALQGHDAIRQQIEHLFASLDDLRHGRGMEGGHALVLQREHARHIRQAIEGAGDRIEREWNTLLASAREDHRDRPGSEHDAIERDGPTPWRTIEALLQSLTFVLQGQALLDELIGLLETMLPLYPEPKGPIDLAAAAAGYAMREQHTVQAAVFGSDPTARFARLTEPVPQDDYGENVELF
jgi:hypothetical protein